MPGSGDLFLESLYLSLRDLIGNERRVILAVSGGADSLALMLGASSILERRDRVIRPLLFATRSEVRQWLSKQQLSWVDDPMNEDRALLRTRVRLDVLPALEKATDARVSLRLARFARFASDDD